MRRQSTNILYNKSMTEENKKTILSIAAPKSVTYFLCELVAEDILAPDGAPIRTYGSIPDGEVHQFSSVLKTIKTYKNGVPVGEARVVDLTSEPHDLSPEDAAQTDPALKTDTFRKGVYLVRSKDAITYYNNGEETARETTGPKGESMAVKGLIPNGPVKEYYEDNHLKAEFNYLNNKLDGQTKRYDPKGRVIAEETYRDGNLEHDAFYYEYFKDAPLKETEHYVDGQLSGARTTLFPNGALNISENYENGKLSGLRRVFYENGILNLEESYSAGKREGARIYYHQNGAVWFKETYSAGLLTGERACYFPTGELQMKEHYTQGLLDGEKKVFTKDGSVLFEEQYAWGTPVNKRRK